MRRFELTALLSGLLSLVSTAVLVFVAGQNWYGKLFESNWLLFNSSGLVWVLALSSAVGIFTAATALWTLRMNRRQEEAARSAQAASPAAAWGADAQEAAFSEEQERLGVVRRSIERKLGFGLAIVLLAALGASVWIVGWKLDSRDAIAEGLERVQRIRKDTRPLDERFRATAGLLLALGALSLVAARVQRAFAREPGGSALSGEAAFHQFRASAFVLGGCLLFFDSLDPEYGARYWRWSALVPVALLSWAAGGRRWSAGGWTALVAFLGLAGLAGAAGPEIDWAPVLAWVSVAALAWATVEAIWNAWAYRTDVEGGFCPLPPTSGTVEILEGRGLTWLTHGLADNFGAQVDEPGTRYFLLEYVGGSALAVLFLFYMSTCVVTIKVWEVGIRERFGEPVMITDYRMLPDGTMGYESNVEILEPGLHFKFPWPIERIVTVPSRDVLSSVEYGAAGHDHETELVLWNLSHYGGEFEMITGDRMLASVVATIQYSVRDPYLYYLYVYPESAADRADKFAGEAEIEQAGGEGPISVRMNRSRHGPQTLMSQVGYRALTDVTSRNSIWALMSERRRQLEDEVRRLAQQRLDALSTGIEVVRVAFTDIHPPVKNDTAMAFENVLRSMEARIFEVNVAEANANQLLPEAKATATETIASALAEGYSKTRLAAGETAVHRALVRTGRGAGSTAAKIARVTMSTQAIQRAFRDKSIQVMILPPGLSFQLYLLEDRTLEEVIPPAPEIRSLPKAGG
jgi:regulator of protease activity HflC (stomatin/prohibitin superfamily)